MLANGKEERPVGPSANMLTASGISSGYGNTTILRDISVGIGSDEIVTIIGRNGVGKSTLIKTLMGLVPVKTGEIRFLNEVVTTLPAHHRARRGIGYIPQGRGIFPGLSVEENLIMGKLINSDGSKKSLQIAFDYFPRLGERRKQRAGTLSGGEQSMLAIGRVLVGMPRLMLLDEPSEGIQPSIVHQIGEDIVRINRELNVPVLFVEQNVELIKHVATRGYVMDKGTIVTQLSRAEITDENAITRFLTV